MVRGNGRTDRSWRWWVGGVAAVAGLAGGVAALWVHAPDLYEPNTDGRLQAIALTRTGVLTAGAALLALAGVLANLLENRRATNLTHARELYTEAVSQLGSDTLDVRLGGIYAMEQIAADPTFHRTVVEVLSAFIRERTTPGQPAAARRSRRTTRSPAPAVRAATRRLAGPPSTDIRAALTVLGRLPARKNIPRADLTGARLAGAQLGDGNVNLSGARLDGVDMSGADLYEVKLTNARLDGTDLSGACLDGADLSGAQLFGANLRGASLAGADLSGALLGKWEKVRRKPVEAEAKPRESRESPVSDEDQPEQTFPMRE